MASLGHHALIERDYWTPHIPCHHLTAHLVEGLVQAPRPPEGVMVDPQKEVMATVEVTLDREIAMVEDLHLPGEAVIGIPADQVSRGGLWSMCRDSRNRDLWKEELDPVFQE